MVLPASRLYRAALAAPHEPLVRVEVWHAGRRVHDGLPLHRGRVDATLTSRVARRLTAVVDGGWYPAGPRDLLAPTGAELRAFRGLVYADGSVEEFPVFRGRINDTAIVEDGTVRVAAVDRAGDITDAGFVGPQASIPGRQISDEMRRLIRDALPEAVFSPDCAVLAAAVPALAWEEDRAKALDDLAAAGGALWYPLADGAFMIRRVPWIQDRGAVVMLSDGPGGTVRTSAAARTRAEVFNTITVTSERGDGSVPVRYTARDTTPGSVTVWNGPFGQRARTVRVQEALSQPQVKLMAESTLRRSIALLESWRLTIVADASLELGDVAELRVRGRRVAQCIIGFSVPLTSRDGDMTVSTRAMVPGGGDV